MVLWLKLSLRSVVFFDGDNGGGDVLISEILLALLACARLLYGLEIVARLSGELFLYGMLAGGSSGTLMLSVTYEHDRSGKACASIALQFEPSGTVQGNGELLTLTAIFSTSE